MANLLIDEVVEHLESLPPGLQEQVLALVRALDLSLHRGVLGSQLTQFAGSISEADIQLMTQAIETGCEQVDLNGSFFSRDGHFNFVEALDTTVW